MPEHNIHHHRSIPACAGEPVIWSSSTRGVGVYPRVCGGTALRDEVAHLCCGLSPRVRGNHLSADGRFARVRSIPACAGEPDEMVASQVAMRVYPRVCGGTVKNGIVEADYGGLSPRVRGNPR